MISSTLQRLDSIHSNSLKNASGGVGQPPPEELELVTEPKWANDLSLGLVFIVDANFQYYIICLYCCKLIFFLLLHFLQQALEERSSLQSLNSQLQHKLAEYFKKKKVSCYEKVLSGKDL